MMSKLVKTPKRILSKNKNAMLYSRALPPTVGFQESKMQIGVKNPVSIIMKSAKPSIPSVMLIFEKANQSTFSTS
jgi:hypothetical protein